MPRNVVTLRPRFLVLPTRANRQRRHNIELRLIERYGARTEKGSRSIEIDFPKRLGGRAAKNAVSAALDRIDRRWRRLFVLYPTEISLRDKGE